MTDKAFLADFWRFPWPIMDVLIAGKSSIDLAELRVHDWDEATEFLRGYGYDPAEPTDMMRMHAVLVEAVAFIEAKLLGPREWSRGIRPPDDILLCDDPRHLLLWASSKSPEERLKRAWACAILRVMHTIAHIEGVSRKTSLDKARDQIVARFDKYIYRDDNRDLWLGDGQNRIRIERVEWKHFKTRHSILLKLLHKRDNVAETIYDYIGVKIVTTRLCDVLMAVKIMRDLYMISYPNCYPARARNTLVDYGRFRTQVETLRDMLTGGSISPDDFETMVARLSASDDLAPTDNPHSSASYRAIQLTGRQLIKIGDERFEWLAKLNREIDGRQLPSEVMKILNELQHLVDGWYTVVEGREESSHFFPFEIQIMDQGAFAEATSGDANHDRYKLSQIRAARKRVLSKVLELHKSAQAEK